jgi:hypothetical protein
MSPNIFFNESKLVERSRSALTNVEKDEWNVLRLRQVLLSLTHKT